MGAGRGGKDQGGRERGLSSGSKGGGSWEWVIERLDPRSPKG